MEYRFTIKEMPEDERPRERLASFGPEALSNHELLAIILSTGYKAGGRTYTALELATQLLNYFGSLKELAKASFEELCKLPGVGPAKACQIKSAFELGNRVALSGGEPKPVIKRPQDVVQYFKNRMSLLKKEEFVVAVLDTKNKLVKDVVISRGTLNASIVHPRDVFNVAVTHMANALILLHNHPSGDPSPSGEDIEITRRLAEAGKLMGIEVLDHIIIGDGNYASLKEMKLF
jgi:DNA repair protein RadC